MRPWIGWVGFPVPQSFYGLDGNVELLYTLKPVGEEWNNSVPSCGYARPSLATLVCTSLSWNATGTILAAGYGRKDPVGWCDHPGALCTWNIEEQVLKISPTPSTTIKN
ncbi:hypothetical protein R1flu_020066 [Riccia fluitans]|uniref:Uncharacterized protein n=1 Tax=Riccia fluitans TaxID=41844 RepID=A0ABD1ZKH0_9MARC